MEVSAQATLEPRQCFKLEEQAPDFCLPAYYRGREIEVCLKDFRGKWLLLFFYSSDFTFVWPTELAAVAAIYPCIRGLCADAIAISTDSVYSHKIFHEISPNGSQVQYPLLSDRPGTVAKAYGVYSFSTGTAYRATFIIDPQGRIRYYSVYPREVGRNIEEIVRTLEGIQYGEATGEGVPAGWVPGMPGIKRDFSKVGDY